MNYWLSGGLVWSMSVLSNNLSQQQNGYTFSKFWHYLTLAGPLVLIGGVESCERECHSVSWSNEARRESHWCQLHYLVIFFELTNKILALSNEVNLALSN
jgi:hypothetical protein